MDELSKEERSVVIIGGFAGGEFSKETLRLVKRHVCLDPEELDAWVVVSKVIHARALNDSAGNETDKIRRMNKIKKVLEKASPLATLIGSILLLVAVLYWYGYLSGFLMALESENPDLKAFSSLLNAGIIFGFLIGLGVIGIVYSIKDFLKISHKNG